MTHMHYFTCLCRETGNYPATHTRMYIYIYTCIIYIYMYYIYIYIFTHQVTLPLQAVHVKPCLINLEWLITEGTASNTFHRLGWTSIQMLSVWMCVVCLPLHLPNKKIHTGNTQVPEMTSVRNLPTMRLIWIEWILEIILMWQVTFLL